MSEFQRNQFSVKMRSKSTDELNLLVEQEQYVEAARLAAIQELKRRKAIDSGEKDIPHILPEDGESLYQETVQSFKRVKRYGFFFQPKYREHLDTGLSAEKVYEVALKSAEKLGWTIINESKNTIQLKRINNQFIATEIILIAIDNQRLSIQSEKITSGKVDRGENSIRVKLFIHVFKEIAGSL